MINLRLALRNLLRNRRRSAATLLAMLIGTCAILLFGGFSASIRYSMHTEYVRSGGHLQIQHRDFYLYGSGNPTAYGIHEYGRILDAIRADPDLREKVLVATPALQFGGIAGNYTAGVSKTVLGIGTVASDNDRMREWNGLDLPLPSTRFDLRGAPGDSAILGVGLARVLHLCKELQVADCPQPAGAPSAESSESLPDDIADLSALEGGQAPPQAGGLPKIELLASHSGGAPNVVSLVVLKAERQGFKELDEALLLLHLEQAQRLVYGRSAPEATSLRVQLRDSATMNEAKERLQELLRKASPGQPLVVMDFYELNPFYVQTLAMFNMIFGFIFALIGAIVLFTVSNTMNTAVVERTVEIGTVRAMGVRQRGVEGLFILEGTLLGAAGTVAGALLALVLAYVVNRLGLTWLPPGSGDRLPLLLLVSNEREMILETIAGLIAIATVSAWWPARRAARLKIVDALRHV
uniref:Putative ABC-type transport system permease component n=1 Tax=Rubrivivax gelatinosus S1 TaxID=1138313 RepID=L8BAG6_RUBGE|nr:putative ABC-type transport system permease component [Rubrivivax gelatinosus S1]